MKICINRINYEQPAQDGDQDGRQGAPSAHRLLGVPAHVR